MFHARDGAIFSKNSTFVFFDGASPITENGIQLRSPSPIMAPGNKITLLSCPISLAIGFFFVLFNIADPDLHQDPASPRYCLSK